MTEAYTNDPLLGPRFETAMACALAHHSDQLRKGTTIPYASHLLAVTAIVLEMGGDEDEAIAALLHDGVEDGGGPAMAARIRDRFGDRVAAIVEANTDTDEIPKPPWKKRKTDYIASLPSKEIAALRVSLADKLHNAQSILRDFRVEGEQLWDRFQTGSDGAGIRWYYRELVDGFEGRADELGVAGRAAVEELRRVVDEIDRLATRG